MMKMKILCMLVLLIITLVVATGCGNSAKTSDNGMQDLTSAEAKQFSKYAFSFEYPRSYSIWTDKLLDTNPNEDSGMVQVAPAEGGFPMFAVSWVKTWEWGLEGGLEAGFEGIGNLEGIERIEMGDIQYVTKTGPRMLYQEGHPMLLRYYTATTETAGETIYGMVGSYYCEDTQRMFSLVTANSTTKTPSSEQAFLDFEKYISTVVCHP